MGSREFRNTKLFLMMEKKLSVVLSLPELIIYIIYLIIFHFTYLHTYLFLEKRKGEKRRNFS